MFYVLSQLKSSEEEKGLCRREKSYAEHVLIYIDFSLSFKWVTALHFV